MSAITVSEARSVVREESSSSQPSVAQSLEANGPILFFDGNCGLCQSSVQFMLNRDRRGRIRYAPLQGTTAERMVEPADRENLSSMVVAANGQLYRHSTAVLLLLKELGGAWRLLATAGFLIPRPLRDAGYRLVAQNRYRWFGTVEACRLPRPGERQRFLD